jgi:hypothetical protein
MKKKASMSPARLPRVGSGNINAEEGFGKLQSKSKAAPSHIYTQAMTHIKDYMTDGH